MVLNTAGNLAELQTLAETVEITPASFEILFKLAKACGLTAGINNRLIYEGCDLEDLETEFIKLCGNITEATTTGGEFDNRQILRGF